MALVAVIIADTLVCITQALDTFILGSVFVSMLRVTAWYSQHNSEL